MKHSLLAPLLALVLCSGTMAQTAATELRIHPVDEAGNAVPLSRAELYIDFWGGGETTTLTVDANGVHVPLDRAWLCDHWRDLCQDQFVEARVILRPAGSALPPAGSALQAAGYAPVVSRFFLWMGGLEDPGDTPLHTATVRFTSGPWMPVKEGETADLTLTMRHPALRKLRFLNQRAEAVPGVSARISLLLAESNHCGVLEGDLIAEATSDDAGEITVPDADAEYVFELGKAHHVLAKPPDADYPMRFSATFTGADAGVVLRELEKQPMHLQFIGRDDLPDLSLTACVAACPCGACCGQIAKSDASGHVDVEDFYPEEYERMTLIDMQGRELWSGSPRTVDDQHSVIQLPKTPPPPLAAPVPLAKP
jgi:hypothetical protein